MVEMDFELGLNLMFFFFCDWVELLDVLDLDCMIFDFVFLVDCFNKVDVVYYCVFCFDD